MGKEETYLVEVHRDEEAEVFYVENSDVPGLDAEADTIDEMTAPLEKLVPFLVQENPLHPKNRSRVLTGKIMAAFPRRQTAGA